MTAEPLGGALDFALIEPVNTDTVPAVEPHAFPPEADYQLDSQFGYQRDEHPQAQLDSAHGTTGLDAVRANYGLTGVGQTVVVIDSGIAFDHYALGGGYGAGYQVVGGWDFAENDDNPYDDGSEGSHGTHVAGIIGSTGDRYGNNTGVAPGVDLIGLRVFNDTGYGDFDYVANALDWVLENQHAFENPITAVNLSLGTVWNSATAPGWASYLESRLEQIESLGIFISVSAGNSFASYDAPGLSYPAASDYVVPVMSVGNDGSLSDFSQRHPNAIAAPGQYIRSTVPDYAGNHNGVADDWASFSGTSMAAPYVAGASTLIRQAMQLVGYAGITQDTIYDHMRRTADTLFDSVTGQSYSRLNLAAAIDALLPDDDHGSSADTASMLLGVGETGSVASGMISSLADADFFTFTAQTTGAATFSAIATHQLELAWDFGTAAARQQGGDWVMDVVAGQSYTFGLATTGGLGYYDLQIDLEPSFAFVDWSEIVGQQTHAGMSTTGERWFRVVAGRDGFLTAQANFANAAGDVDLMLYDPQMQMLDQSITLGDAERVEYLATAGQEFFLRVSGDNEAVNFQLTNMVELSGTTLTVSGTSGNDEFRFAAGLTHQVVVNGVAYQFDSAAIDSVIFAGGAGDDMAVLTGSTGTDTATLRVGQVVLSGNTYSVTATDVEQASVLGGGGSDRATLYDTAGDEVLTAHHDVVTLAGAGFLHQVQAFAMVSTYATGGNDLAYLHGTDGADNFASWSYRAVLAGASYFNDARGFDSVTAYGYGGKNSANFHGTAGDDTYTSWGDRGMLRGEGYASDARDFSRLLVYGRGGNDQAELHGTAAGDTFAAWSDRAVMYAAGYAHDLRDFADVTAYGEGGNDRATFHGTTGDDTLSLGARHGWMSGDGYRNEAFGFANHTAYGNGGNDGATLHGTDGNDTYAAWSDRAILRGSGYFNDARGFISTVAYAYGGNDRAMLHDSAGDDELVAEAWGAYLSDGASFRNEARGFDQVDAYRDLAGDDLATVRSIDYLFRMLGGWTTEP